jgi:hypothetical protein
MVAGSWTDVLDEGAAAHPGVSRSEAGGVTTYETGGRPFAAASGPKVEFLLKPDIARAALRTPGTEPSTRGPDWVVFEPPEEPDRYDLDRLRSWFDMAARLAGG